MDRAVKGLESLLKNEKFANKGGEKILKDQKRTRVRDTTTKSWFRTWKPRTLTRAKGSSRQ